MAKKTKSPPKPKPIGQYEHRGKQRANNPQVGLVTPDTDPDRGEQQGYQFDPHLDPSLHWAGKAERTSFEVPTVSLHVHERIDPKTILKQVKRRANGEQQPGLFEEHTPLRDAIDFYKHKDNWSNRFVAGDSLLVMNSLLQKEGMGGKVQMVYFDPPYGIKYGSNFQPFVNKREVIDGKDTDLTGEPEMIKAFRDTWELGIHSYLSYMRDRLMLIRELLAESGSVFVQIGDENLHRVGLVLDDIFGAENRIATISYATTGSSSARTLPQVSDYLLWYGKDKEQAKYRQLYEALSRAEIVSFFSSYVMVELADGTERSPTENERFDPGGNLPEGARLYRRMPLVSRGTSKTGRSEPYEWNGKIFKCPKNSQWRVSKEGMDYLAEKGRLVSSETQDSLSWKRYEEEVPGRQINNIWAEQTSASNKRYVVETAVKAIQRCMLMVTDPGDLVLDITCGSGTTAFVAEQWGRRWITCDTSRVALTLAKQRLMTSVFDYYKLANPEVGVGNGFEYKTVPAVSAKILSEDTLTETVVYDQPLKDSSKKRVTGPFTVEAVPAPYVQSLDGDDDTAGVDDLSITRSGETLRQTEWRDELLKSGIRAKGGQHINFSDIEPLSGTRYLHAEATTCPDKPIDGVREPATAHESKRAVVCFGPEHSPMEQRQVESAIQEAEKHRPKPEIIIFVAFQFDPEAAKDIEETDWPGVTLLQVQMNADMQTGDLKKKQSSSENFWLVGQPDVRLHQLRTGPYAGKWQVAVNGFDYFNTETGELTSGDESNIAVWMLDTDYDGRSLYPSQIFFPMTAETDDKGGWRRLAKALRAEVNDDLVEYYHGAQSIPFEMGEHERIAVKIVDDRGIESLKVMPVYEPVRSE
ncbi:MAG: site-specific DNA-methyltransferase [Pseudohongiellaceae bacterium]